jgi:hypothetical protein
MFTQHQRGDRATRPRRLGVMAGGLAATGALLASLSGFGTANAATRAPAVPGTTVAASASSPPGISSVSFAGTAGPGVASPAVTLTGSGFGATAPKGTSDNSTGCGPYTANGDVYGNKLYVVDDGNFEAGFSDSNGPNCIGIKVVSWSPTKVVLQFGNAYGTFAHWYLSNGDGYAISIKNAIWGGTVSGLS